LSDGERMKVCRALVVALTMMTLLTIASMQRVKAEGTPEKMKTFFDSVVLETRIQVNATMETRPTENVTIDLILTGQADIEVKYFNLSVFGFVNGTDRILMANITDGSFPLNSTSKTYNYTFSVPQQVWGTTYGEITLAHSVKYGLVTVNNDGLTCGFSMTNVRNVYLEGLEQQVSNFGQLNQTFWDIFQMNLTTENLATLNKTYQGLQGSVGDLDNTRRVVAVLGITTVFFVATTLYFILRKPKENW
jgi:hypothetical protein